MSGGLDRGLDPAAFNLLAGVGVSQSFMLGINPAAAAIAVATTATTPTTPTATCVATARTIQLPPATGQPPSVIMSSIKPELQSSMDCDGSSSSDAGPSTSSMAPSLAPTSFLPRKKITARPAANAACHDICEYLMQYSICTKADDIEFALKALESLHKKLKDRPVEMEFFLQSIDTKGDKPGGCVLVPRTLDGRLQVAGKKGFPHVIYAKIFRFDETNKTELKALPGICQHGFDLKEETLLGQQIKIEPPSQFPSGDPNAALSSSPLQVCVNPYHYKRVPTSEYTPGEGFIGLISDSPTQPRSFLAYTQPALASQLQQPQHFHQLMQQQQEQTSPPQLNPSQQLQLLQQRQLLQRMQPVKQSPPANGAAPHAASAAEAAPTLQTRLAQQIGVLELHLQQPAQQLPLAAPAAPQGEVLPADEASQVQWEEEIRDNPWKGYLMAAWKSEERRLLGLEPPRFMPALPLDDLEAWYYVHEERRNSPGGIPEGWFDSVLSHVVPEDEEKRGHLQRYMGKKRKTSSLVSSSTQPAENSPPTSSSDTEASAAVRQVQQEQVEAAADDAGDDADDDAVEGEPSSKRARHERSDSSPLDVVGMEDEGASSSASSHAVSMSYSQQGHFSQPESIDPNLEMEDSSESTESEAQPTDNHV